MSFYFAYGSNMDEDRLCRRVGDFPPPNPAFLCGFRLAFNKQAYGKPDVGYANIVCDPDATVYGILYELTREQMDALAEVEGVPRNHYVEKTLEVATDIGFFEALTHIAHPNKISDGLLPERAYLNHILAGSQHLPPDYVEAIKKHPVKDTP